MDRSIVVAPWFVPRVGSLRHRYLWVTSRLYRELCAAFDEHEARFADSWRECAVKSPAECDAEAAIWRRFGEPDMAEMLERYGERQSRLSSET